MCDQSFNIDQTDKSTSNMKIFLFLCFLGAALIELAHCTTTEDAAIVKESWNEVKKHYGREAPEEIGTHIIKSLLTAYPSKLGLYENYGLTLEEIFNNEDFHLYAAEYAFPLINYMIVNIGDSEKLDLLFQELREAYMGISPNDMKDSVNVLLQSAAELLVTEAPEVTEAWSRVIVHLLDSMVAHMIE